MIPAVLALLMFQAGEQNLGTVTGVVRSSAAGVRVYAQQVRDPADANSPAAPLEGLSVTDATGSYRLELPAGRYYIASGSVTAPTYFPGTRDLANARLVTVVAGAVVEGIDFDSFVPAQARLSLLVQPSLPRGTLTGTVRYPDGSPAVGVVVMAFVTAVVIPPGTVPPWFPMLYGQTDAAGRYRLTTDLTNSFYVVAGFAESPALYTGGHNTAAPKPVTITPPMTVDALDLEIPFRVPRSGTTVRGRVLTRDGTAAVGARVLIAFPSPAAMGVMGARLPSAYQVPEVPVNPDGTFELQNVVPGFYNVRASRNGKQVYDSFEIGNIAITDLTLTLPE